MSGIAGVIRFGGQVEDTELEAMLQAMRRRGLDRQAFLDAGNAGFAQALLATTPEATAEQQPWRHPETGCVVVSDSRLDNRPELVRALGLDARCVDAVGDGELLHAAWQRWGEDCADRLLGDFAFAIWDPARQALFCARDIMGVRPLYFHHVPGRLFAFASDIQALLALKDVPRRINEGRIADAMVGELEGIDRTSTFYLDIERLPPARTLRVDMGGARQAEYWLPIGERPVDLPQSEGEWIEAVRTCLEQAVRYRLRGSGPVGAMVSGGLDSSSAAALGQRILEDGGPGARLPTFSAINSAGPCAETDAVRLMLAAFDFDATTVDLQALEGVAPEVLAHLEEMREPFDGTMTLISAVYAAAAVHGTHALLDGLPADNLYTAGGLFRGLALSGQWGRLWREARALHRTWAHPHPGTRAVQTLAGTLAPRTLRRPWDALQQRRHYRDHCKTSSISQELASRVALRNRFEAYRQDMARTRLGNPNSAPHTIMTAAYITAAVERYNRIASFHGVEPRHPFLDRRVIELHAWLPLHLRLRQGWYKWVLRAAVEGLLPGEVTWRRGKEHLGYQFNRSLLGRWQGLAGGSANFSPALVKAWQGRRPWMDL